MSGLICSSAELDGVQLRGEAADRGDEAEEAVDLPVAAWV